VRSRRSVHAAVAAIVAVGILVIGAAPAAAGGKQKHDKLRLVATVTQFQFLDLGTPGPSLGDEIVFFEVLRKEGREAGIVGGVCTVTEVVPPYTSSTHQCITTLSLRRGKITLQGLPELQGIDDPGPFTTAITGGTGAYRSASGEAKVLRPTPTTTIYKLSFNSHGKKKKGRGRH
jgi:hypothetical protein